MVLFTRYVTNKTGEEHGTATFLNGKSNQAELMHYKFLF